MAKSVNLEERRPVWGYPGYSITPDGHVYSVNNSKTGESKLMGRTDLSDPDRKVTLCRGGTIRKQRRVAALVKDTWGTLEHFNAAVDKARAAKEASNHE